jgi:ATP-dependent DNA helicase DinG
VSAVLAAAKKVPSDAPEEIRPRAVRLVQSATALVDDVILAESAAADQVVWVEGTDANPVLRVAPLDVAPLLRDGLWNQRTAVLTSATLPARLPERLGVDSVQITELDVGSPFDYEHHALLYCAAHLPDPRSPDYLAALTDELGDLLAAAGGRTLALFTSFRVLDEAAAALQLRFGDDLPILTQRSLPKARLLEVFTQDPATSLFATMGFWQGVDVPGPSLSLVTIDRIPFPRPDEPLLQARRERAGPQSFALIDLPRAATLLAQGAGRLIRTATDHGVVAVLDPRLARAGYRWEMVQSLPPMRRTKDPAEARRALEAIRDG